MAAATPVPTSVATHKTSEEKLAEKSAELLALLASINHTIVNHAIDEEKHPDEKEEMPAFKTFTPLREQVKLNNFTIAEIRFFIQCMSAPLVPPTPLNNLRGVIEDYPITTIALATVLGTVGGIIGDNGVIVLINTLSRSDETAEFGTAVSLLILLILLVGGLTGLYVHDRRKTMAAHNKSQGIFKPTKNNDYQSLHDLTDEQKEEDEDDVNTP